MAKKKSAKKKPKASVNIKIDDVGKLHKPEIKGEEEMIDE